jgi:hypothetical protein
MTRLRTMVYRRKGTWVGVLLLIFVSQPEVAAQQLPSVPVAADTPLELILQRLSEADGVRARNLNHYTSTRSYRLHNLRFEKTAEMTVLVTYRAPGSKAFTVVSESGLRVLCHRVLRKMIESEVEASTEAQRRLSRLTTENYDFQFSRLDRNEGRPVYVLTALPKSKSKYLMRGEVWVDIADLAVSRIAGQPAKNPSFWIRDSMFVYQYEKVQSFWLPSSMQSEADARMFGRTEVKVEYGDYRINSEEVLAGGENCTLPACTDGAPSVGQSPGAGFSNSQFTPKP